MHCMSQKSSLAGSQWQWAISFGSACGKHRVLSCVDRSLVFCRCYGQGCCCLVRENFWGLPRCRADISSDSSSLMHTCLWERKKWWSLQILGTCSTFLSHIHNPTQSYLERTRDQELFLCHGHYAYLPIWKEHWDPNSLNPYSPIPWNAPLSPKGAANYLLLSI